MSKIFSIDGFFGFEIDVSTFYKLIALVILAEVLAIVWYSNNLSISWLEKLNYQAEQLIVQPEEPSTYVPPPRKNTHQYNDSTKPKQTEQPKEVADVAETNIETPAPPNNEEVADVAETNIETPAPPNNEKTAQEQRNKIIAFITSGKPYFGVEEYINRHFEFQINFTSYDHSTGEVTAIMDYYPLDDRTVLLLAGRLERNTLTLQHSGVIRKGLSETGWTYTFNINDDKLQGTYRRIKGPSHSYKVWIALSENERLAKKAEVAEINRIGDLIESSVTPTVNIVTYSLFPKTEFWHELQLTDVYISDEAMPKTPTKRTKNAPFAYSKQKDVFLFKNIKTIKKYKSRSRSTRGEYVVEIHYLTPSRKTLKHEISFQDQRIKRDAFYSRLVDAWNTWKIKYAEIY